MVYEAMRLRCTVLVSAAYFGRLKFEMSVLSSLSLGSISDLGSEERPSISSLQSSPPEIATLSLPSFSGVSDFDSSLSLPSQIATDSDNDSDTDSVGVWSDVGGILSEDEANEDEDPVPPDPSDGPQTKSDNVFTTPLYKGAKLTIFDSFLLILQFALR